MLLGAATTSLSADHARRALHAHRGVGRRPGTRRPVARTCRRSRTVRRGVPGRQSTRRQLSQRRTARRHTARRPATTSGDLHPRSTHRIARRSSHRVVGRETVAHHDRRRQSARHPVGQHRRVVPLSPSPSRPARPRSTTHVSGTDPRAAPPRRRLVRIAARSTRTRSNIGSPRATSTRRWPRCASSARICWGAGRSARLRTLLDRIGPAGATDTVCALLWGWCHYLTGRYVEAQESLDTALAVAPDTFDRLIAMPLSINVALGRGDVTSALATARDVTTTAGDLSRRPGGTGHRGRCGIRLGRISRRGQGGAGNRDRPGSDAPAADRPRARPRVARDRRGRRRQRCRRPRGRCRRVGHGAVLRLAGVPRHCAGVRGGRAHRHRSRALPGHRPAMRSSWHGGARRVWDWPTC